MHVPLISHNQTFLPEILKEMLRERESALLPGYSVRNAMRVFEFIAMRQIPFVISHKRLLI